MAWYKRPTPVVRGTLPLTAGTALPLRLPRLCGLESAARVLLMIVRVVSLLRTLRLFLPGPGRATAACTVDPDFLDGVGSGCARCSADGSKCEECVERYGLKKDGTCVPCQPVRVGKLLEEDAPVFW